MKPRVDVAQTPWELDRLLEIVEAHQPDRVLEVGVWEGGTLWEWLRIADTVVAIDDTMRHPGPEAWNEWARRHDSELTLLHGRSDWPEIIAAAENKGPYDLVFIDADHTYESVEADWEAFSPMVDQGGILVLHDILPRPAYGVDRLWREIKAVSGSRTVEIVEAGNESANGIGIVWATC